MTADEFIHRQGCCIIGFDEFERDGSNINRLTDRCVRRLREEGFPIPDMSNRLTEGEWVNGINSVGIRHGLHSFQEQTMILPNGAAKVFTWV